jgi:hypothetical protein
MLRSRLFYITAWYINQPAIQLNDILNSRLKIWIVSWKLSKTMSLHHQKRLTSMYIIHGWIQHDLVWGRGWSASSGAVLCRSCVPPAHQHTVFELLFTLHWGYCSNFCISFCLYYFLLYHEIPSKSILDNSTCLFGLKNYIIIIIYHVIV